MNEYGARSERANGCSRLLLTDLYFATHPPPRSESSVGCLVLALCIRCLKMDEYERYPETPHW
jgi:hypothetical protein